MKLFACDLDNTLLFSKRYASEKDICVEMIGEKEQGFMTPDSIRMLREINQGDFLFLPITTRSIEQYKRIEWQTGCEPEYAIVANGAILLRKGESVPEWREQTEKTIEKHREEMIWWREKLVKQDRFIRCRMVDDAFLFAYAKDEIAVKGCVEEYRLETELNVVYSGRKIYFFPDCLNKGAALARFTEQKLFEKTISAGDSAIDIPMLDRTDFAIVPPFFPQEKLCGSGMIIMGDTTSFPEFVLRTVLSL